MRQRYRPTSISLKKGLWRVALLGNRAVEIREFLVLVGFLLMSLPSFSEQLNAVSTTMFSNTNI